MSIITKASAKNYFLTGAFPTQTQFADTIDSYLGLGETGSQTLPTALVLGATLSVSAKVSAKGGLNTTIISANSLNVTGDLAATAGRVTASAATISNKVSATQIYASTVTVSGANITGVKGTAAIIASVSGSVTTGYLAIWNANSNIAAKGPNVYNNLTATPTGTTSSSFVMLGLAGAITPSSTGVIQITITGNGSNSTSSDGGKCIIAYGTGTAPSNGAAATGTTIGNQVTFNNITNAGQSFPFTCNAIITGLVVGTAYWIDLQFAEISGSTFSISQANITAKELH